MYTIDEKRKVTLHDIARKAGVSSATVSMALSGKGHISEEMKEIVRKTAKELGYKRRGTKNSTGKCIAILTYATNEWAYLQQFITPMFTQIETKLAKYNLYPIIIPITRMSTRSSLHESILSSNAAGLLSIHFSDEQLFEEVEYEGIPVTIINNSSLQKKFHSICTDDFQGAYDGTNYLIECGHRNFLYVDYWRKDQPAVFVDRNIGFKKAIDEHDIHFEPAQRITYEIEDQTQLKSSLMGTLRLYPDTTAIFAHDDRVGICIYTALKELGYRIPEDISLLAPGDTLDYSLPYIPQITTMKIDTNLLGSLAADGIIHHINSNTETGPTLKVTQQLVRRSTCRVIS